MKKWLKKHPRADLNGDGVLTFEEGQKSRASIKKASGAGQAKERAAANAGEATPPTKSNVSYGPHERDTLDFWQAKADGPTPALVFLHGGSFKAGDKSAVLSRPIFAECLSAGISVVSANYRFSSDAPFPAPMLDGARAVQFVRTKAKEWNLDPTRIALSGSSAGGTMALWIALHDDLADPKSDDPVERESTRVSCVVGYSAPASFAPDYVRKYAGVENVGGAVAQLMGVSSAEDLASPKMQDILREAVPITYVTKDDPPLWLTYGGRMSDAPFAANAPQSGWIHHVCLGMPLKKAYDKLGLECHLYDKENVAPEGADVDFLTQHLFSPQVAQR